MNMGGSKTTGSTVAQKIVFVAFATSNQPHIPPQQNAIDLRA